MNREERRAAAAGYGNNWRLVLVTANGKEGIVVAITMEGNLIIDLRRSGGGLMEVKLHKEVSKPAA
jgi:hypothetical protein